MALYDELKTKSSEELKSYIIHEDEYTEEMAEIAEQILKERGEEVDVDQLITENSPNSKEKIKGWLIVFLVYIFIDCAISVCQLRINIVDPNYEFSVGGIIELLFYVCLVGFGFDSVVRRKPNAVYLCEAAAIYSVAVSIGTLMVSHGFKDMEFETVRRLITLFGSFGWVLYFKYSKQVRRIFPEEKRMVFPKDKAMVAVLFFPVVIGLSDGFFSSLKKAHDENIVSPLALVFRNESTDGVIAFSVPDGYSCEMNNIPTTHFYVTKDKDSVEVFGGFAYGYDEKNQNYTVNELFDDMRNELQSKGTENSTLSVFEQKGNVYVYHRRYAYWDAKNADEAVELDAYVLWCKGTNKYAVVKEVRPLNTPSSTIEAIVAAWRFE